jgi:hypothetical protein
MFDIEICSSRQVVLVRFREQLTEDDFITLDRLAAEGRGGAQDEASRRRPPVAVGPLMRPEVGR